MKVIKVKVTIFLPYMFGWLGGTASAALIQYIEAEPFAESLIIFLISFSLLGVARIVIRKLEGARHTEIVAAQALAEIRRGEA